MKKNIFIVSCMLLSVAYAELWWDRVSEKADIAISKLYSMQWELHSIESGCRYIEVGNDRVENALEKMSKENNDVYLSTDKLESKLEEIVDELRGLNGTMNMLTH